jgi:hypothetical protein
MACQPGSTDDTSWGAYTAPEYQFARRWALGCRFDYVQQPHENDDHAGGASAWLTFQQSELCFWRLGVEHIDRNFEDEGLEDETIVFLQWNFGIGAHRAHKY